MVLGRRVNTWSFVCLVFCLFSPRAFFPPFFQQHQYQEFSELQLLTPRAVCSACGSSGRDTKPRSAPWPWLRDRHTPCLPLLLMDGAGRTRATTLRGVCCLRWRSSPYSHPCLARRLQGKAGSPAEAFCRAGNIRTDDSPTCEKEEDLLMPLPYHPSGVSHWPPAKGQSYTSTDRQSCSSSLFSYL